jgi:hypothetical protein
MITALVSALKTSCKRHIAIDVTGGKIYWADSGSGAYKIQRANLNDGMEIEDLVSAETPAGIALNL